ncbi:MAG: hypothetical protein IKO36_03680 [Bacteroidaceae bacterium]|nr:hypothetical protein [Bacteroidaceae bacterium]
MANLDNSSITVKCMGKSVDKRKVRITIDKKQYDVYLFRRRFVIPAYDDELHDKLRSIAIQHAYWLWGLDDSDKRHSKEQEISIKYNPNPIIYDAEDWKRETKKFIELYTDDLQVFNEQEKKYLLDNIGDDYYKHINMYPSSFDFKTFYKLTDLKFI